MTNKFLTSRKPRSAEEAIVRVVLDGLLSEHIHRAYGRALIDFLQRHHRGVCASARYRLLYPYRHKRAFNTTNKLTGMPALGAASPFLSDHCPHPSNRGGEGFTDASDVANLSRHIAVTQPRVLEGEPNRQARASSAWAAVTGAGVKLVGYGGRQLAPPEYISSGFCPKREVEMKTVM